MSKPEVTLETITLSPSGVTLAEPLNARGRLDSYHTSAQNEYVHKSIPRTREYTIPSSRSEESVGLVRYV